MQKLDKCNVFGVCPVRMRFAKFVVVSVCWNIVLIVSVMVLTLLNPLEKEKIDGKRPSSKFKKDYAIAANTVMGILIAICLLTLYAVQKRKANLLLPYLLCKILWIIWLLLYSSMLVLDNKSTLDYGPNIYPLRYLVQKEIEVRKESTLFPVILFIVSLEIIVLEIHTVIIVCQCRKSMLESSTLTISTGHKKKTEKNNEDTSNSQNHT